MADVTVCPSCQDKLNTKGLPAGTRIKCVQCRAIFGIPDDTGETGLGGAAAAPTAARPPPRATRTLSPIETVYALKSDIEPASKEEEDKERRQAQAAQAAAATTTAPSPPVPAPPLDPRPPLRMGWNAEHRAFRAGQPPQRPFAPEPEPAPLAEAIGRAGDIIYESWPFEAAEAQRRQEETARRLRLPVEQNVLLPGGLPMTFILIPAGAAMLGSRTEEHERGGDEYSRMVRITHAFYLGRYPVTQGQWESVVGKNPSRFQGEADSNVHPVEQVSRGDVEALFLARLQGPAPPGWQYRLPTEAEWEYACRAGTETAYSFGPRPLKGAATYSPTADRHFATTPVGQYAPNAWGLCDMHGNVCEWCRDWYEATYPREAAPDDPVNDRPGPGTQADESAPPPPVVVRGGSYIDDPRLCRSASRIPLVDGRYSMVGFRVALVRT